MSLDISENEGRRALGKFLVGVAELAQSKKVDDPDMINKLMATGKELENNYDIGIVRWRALSVGISNAWVEFKQKRVPRVEIQTQKGQTH